MSKQNEPPLVVWVANRLRCMSAAEVVHRIKQVSATPRVKRSVLCAPAEMPVHSTQANAPVFARPAGINAKSYIAEADAILDGNVTLFAAEQVTVGHLPVWNRNPRAGHGACLGAKPSTSNSEREPGDDIKYVWELNRHLQWVRLAQAYVLSADERYCRGLAGQLRSWLDQCSPLTGPNWTSAMELAIRLTNWSVVWQMLGGWDGVLFKDADGEQLRTRWLESIYSHCQFISRNFSRHSSANNHLIGELAGLYVGARTWQFGEQSGAWAAQAKAELEHEAVIQHFSDGVNREQAFAYQAYTCECLAVAGIYGQCSGDALSGEFWNALRRAYRFLRSTQDVGGNFPMVGDADDGALLRLEPYDGLARSATVLALGDALFCERAAKGPSDTVRWLLGDGANLPSMQVCDPPTDWKFSDGGYFFFGSNFGEQNEIKGMIDCGPLGYLSIAAHGHADALAIGLSIAGEECLVDPGTFAYGGEYRWRNYFRGTSAHNTVRVDGLDQSVSGGRFMWTRKAKANVDRAPKSPGQFDFVGFHDGYMRLRDPVRHVRSITYDDNKMSLLVRDDVLGKSKHQVEQFWHFAPNIRVQLSGDGVAASGNRFQLRMYFSRNDLNLELIRGDEDLPLGWYSRGYGLKEATTVLRVRAASNAVSIEARFTIKVIDVEGGRK